MPQIDSSGPPSIPSLSLARFPPFQAIVTKDFQLSLISPSFFSLSPPFLPHLRGDNLKEKEGGMEGKRGTERSPEGGARGAELRISVSRRDISNGFSEERGGGERS